MRRSLGKEAEGSERSRLEAEEKRRLRVIWSREISAQSECLGSKRRRKTWQPAKSPGELATSDNPRISEWGNPIDESLSS